MSVSNLYKFLVFLSFCVISQVSMAQNIELTGSVVDGVTNAKKVAVEVRASNAKNTTMTNERGEFTMSVPCVGELNLTFTYDNHSVERTYPCPQDGNTLDLGQVKFDPPTVLENDQIFVVTLGDEVNDVDQENVSALLTARNDRFAATAAFTFGVARFRIRGYDSQNTDVFLNGIQVNELENGRTIWSQWGGLNDVLRNRTAQIGLLPTDYAIAGIGGSSSIDLRASSQRKQTRFTYSATNRSYTNRLMGTYSTGLLESGWALSISASHRWAHEGYIPGTWFDGYGYFVSIDKVLSEKSAFNIVALGSPTRRAGRGPVQQEMLYLARSNFYNPYWGYQQGEKRNSRVRNSHQPIFMLRHDFTPNKNLRWTNSFSHQFGENGNTRLDWFNANDPRPDYYRKLPSFQTNPDVAALVKDRLLRSEAARQINWDEILLTNLMAEQTTIENANGVEGNSYTGKRAEYIVSNRRYDSKKFNFNSNANLIVNDELTIQLNGSYRFHEGEVYQEVEDLLGGDFILNLDNFAINDFPDPAVAENDLDNPNKIIGLGDKYAFDYLANIRNGGLWGQAQWDLSKWQAHLGVGVSQTSFWRTGRMRNGRFPNNSFGDSEKQEFTNYNVKAGTTYKIDGRNFIHASGYVGTRAPYFRESFISPRTRNDVIPNLQNEKIFSGEIGYDMKAPNLKVKALAYYTEFRDRSSARSYYSDNLRNFVNVALNGINTKHIGTELAIEYKASTAVTLHAVAAIGEYTMNSRPVGTFTQDNNGEELLKEADRTVYAKNLRLGNTPQQAYTAGLTYRNKKYWSVYLDLNYFNKVYTDFSPIRRTSFATDILEPDSKQYVDILSQEQLDGAFTANISINKSWKVGWLKEKSSFINAGFSVTNFLDNQDYITGGFEQLRFDFDTRDIETFPSKYFYFQGLNYFLNVSYRFY